MAIDVSTVPALIDSTGGRPSATLYNVSAGSNYSKGDIISIKNSLASLAAKVNTLLAVLQEMQAAGQASVGP